jgi:hypothetical protein
MQTQFLIAADPDYAGAAAASGVAGFIGIVMILLFVYSVIAFLLPIFVYRIMRRGTESYQRLEEIRDLLRKQARFVNQPGVEPPNSDVGALHVPEPDEVSGRENAVQENGWVGNVKKNWNKF